jgi:protein-L-isoaspartate(D-aspartate) O-methyltransferase
MMDFEKARMKMVDCQVRTNDVTEHRLLAALMEVPREAFVSKQLEELAYIDEDLALGGGRYLMEPAPMARLLQLADIAENDIALVVGAGAGYSTAVVSLLASSVVAVEEDEALAASASERLSELGYDNVAVVRGNHAQGYPKEAPFDVIFINGAVEFVPDALVQQLAEGGRLVAVEGTGNAASARVYEKNRGIVGSRNVMNCAIKPLPGFQKEVEFTF